MAEDADGRRGSTPSARVEEQRRRASLRRLREVPVLPTLLTAGNLACGVTAIFCAASTHGLLLQGAILIFAAMVCDMLDGKVARMTGTTGQFGTQLDSLADVVSFGVAPAMLVHRLVLGENPTRVWGEGETLIWSISVLYAVCTALRLARYNVEHSAAGDAEATASFTGLPSPGAAAFLCVWVLFFAWFQDPDHYHQSVMDLMGLPQEVFVQLIRFILSASLPLMALLMVSKIRFPHIGNMVLSERGDLRGIVLLMLLIVLVATARIYGVLLVVSGYVLVGLAAGMPAAIRRWRAGHDILREHDDDDDGDPPR